uniref:Uncharacterized protein n=1 Tax=Staphylococcus aureus TaxID=1280 RepID=D2JDY7_STAAU|nr:hypothetical protein SAP058A_023 [Staphylococcus aureus]
MPGTLSDSKYNKFGKDIQLDRFLGSVAKLKNKCLTLCLK